LKSSFFQKYLLPGFVFQSVIIAGGYGTGRELVEYFLKSGPLGGLLGMFLTTLMWSLILALSFELARQFKAYDYRRFFRQLLGRYWFLFEIVYIVYLFIVLAVIGSAAGILLRDNFHLPYIWGVGLMLAAVGLLTFEGSRWIERFLSFWSFVLYGIYIAFFILCFLHFGPEIKAHLAQGIIKSSWLVNGFKYALYNLANVAAVLFCLTHLETRREALTAGLVAGVIGIIPGVLFFLSVTGFYPGILPEEIPVVYALNKLQLPSLLILFQIMLFGTLIETGTGLIHSVNERLQSALQERGRTLPRSFRPLLAAIFLLIALGFSTFGLIDLIAKGYGAASWAFLFLFIIPLVSIGLIKILRPHHPPEKA